jgi:beta-RFAP synthase
MNAASDNRRPTSVRVWTTGRLHLGFFDLGAGAGRRFGSLGLALDAPATRLSLRRAATASVTGAEAARAAKYLARLQADLGIPGAHALDIEQAIPAHAGLGSGTQLALAVAAALRALHGLAPAPREDAIRLGRGGRSGIGIGLFAHGGAVADGGAIAGSGVAPPLLARLPVPAAWRVLLLLDRAAQGLSGAAERAAFAGLPPMAPGVAGALCRLVLMGALPALAEADLPGFGAAIGRMQDILGDYFAPAQGGRCASPAVGAALAQLTAAGAVGIGQSSWGPTGFAFAADAGHAEALAAHLRADPASAGLDIRVCAALNRGARISIDDEE